MNTVKIIIDWGCNLNCSYCCNEDTDLRNTFKPITLNEIRNSDYRDYEITGGEIFLPLVYPKLMKVLRRIPKRRNIYLYTNGTLLTEQRISIISFLYPRVKGINVGYHEVELDWEELRKVDKIIPIRLWVREDKVENWMKEYFEIRSWKLGECNNITTDRFVLVGE